MAQINNEDFAIHLPAPESVWPEQLPCDIDLLCHELVEVVYAATRDSKIGGGNKTASRPLSAIERWNSILLTGDDKKLWAAINWKGSLEQASTDKPVTQNFVATLKRF